MGLFVIPLSVCIPPRSFESLGLLGPTSLIALFIASFSSFGAPGYLLYQPTFALLQVPSLNESSTDFELDDTDEIAFKMKFGDKEEGVLDMLIYTLKDQNFVVNNNSRICPDKNCEFEFKDTDLVYQPGSNRITMNGNMKVDTGDVTKISEISLDIQPVEAS